MYDMESIYEPIKRKINSWLSYEQNKPKIPYKGNEKLHDDYRSKNDLDCILNDGNLHADTIISLWLPLRMVLVRINGYDKLNELENINNRFLFLKKLILDNNTLEKYLPVDDERVVLLSKLFEIGQKKENTMILPRRDMQSKGEKCYDYMPYFLYECFQGGMFSEPFENDIEKLREWVNEQKLSMFFKEEKIQKENIIDLSGSGDIKNNIPPSKMELNMLKNYIDILEKRSSEI